MNDILTAPPAGSAELVNGALVRAQAAARTAFYGAVSMAAWSAGLPFTAVERTYFQHALGDAYELHVRMLARPGMREVLRRLELEDLATLPALLATAPLADVCSRADVDMEPRKQPGASDHTVVWAEFDIDKLSH